MGRRDDEVADPPLLDRPRLQVAVLPRRSSRARYGGSFGPPHLTDPVRFGRRAMEMNRREALKTLGAAVGAAFVPGRASAQGGEISVGSLLDGTGPINIYGLPMIDSTKFAVDDINARGGVLGRKLRLIQLDAQSDNQIYAQYATKLLVEDKVAVLMGGITSASREAVRPVVGKYKQVYFYNEQYEGGVCDKLVFCTGVTPAQQLAATGLKGKIPIVSATFGLGNEQVVLTPEEVEGLVVIYPYFQELENAVNREWVRRWHQRFGANYAYITDSACTVWNGWHLWAMAVKKAGSLERDAVTKALESGLTFKSPEGEITLNPESHHVVHTVHLAKVNKQRGFSIIKTFPNVAPTDTMEVCDLIKNPNQAKQYTPKF